MKIVSVKTHKITKKDKDIFVILDKYLLKLEEKSILAITSKIVSIAEGSLVKIDSVDKDELIRQESQFYLPRDQNPYNVSFTITHNMLAATAGIDESNGNGYYILWPKNPQKSANKIREYLKKKFHLKNVGVIITDSKTSPLRWGVTSAAIAYSGLKPLKDYIGKKDLFERKFAFEKLSIIDSLASAASVVMGEGAEQTPMAIIKDLSFVEFQDRNPTKKELEDLCISPEKDLYGPFLKNVQWKKGSAKQNSSAKQN
ncbi:MAG: coenzyme F420-0:L-glutamate ligase [Candidatus Levybacteria bacterium]|nr:coenzyme F420-0:L-glutamate ligase [Candidatus Levybacteria bacterium]